MTHWNWLDWVLAIIVFLSVITAMRKGFVAELVSLASVIAALLVAALNYKRLAPLLGGITNTREVALGASFIILFVGVLAVGALVSFIGRKLIRTVELQWFDRFLGAAFGLVRGILIDCVMLLIMMTFAIKQRAVQGSTLAPYVTTGSRLLAVVMPSEMRSGFRAGLEKFKSALIQTDKKATEVHPAGKEDL